MRPADDVDGAFCRREVANCHRETTARRCPIAPGLFDFVASCWDRGPRALRSESEVCDPGSPGDDAGRAWPASRAPLVAPVFLGLGAQRQAPGAAAARTEAAARRDRWHAKSPSSRMLGAIPVLRRRRPLRQPSGPSHHAPGAAFWPPGARSRRGWPWWGPGNTISVPVATSTAATRKIGPMRRVSMMISPARARPIVWIRAGDGKERSSASVASAPRRPSRAAKRVTAAASARPRRSGTTIGKGRDRTTGPNRIALSPLAPRRATADAQGF